MKKHNKDFKGFILKNAIRLAALGLSIVCVASALAPAVPKLSAEEISESTIRGYENQLSNIEDELQKLKAKQNQTVTDLASAKEKKAALDQEITLLSNKISLTEKMIEELSYSVAVKENEIIKKNKDYEAQYEIFKERVRLAHEDGEVGYLEMIFGADDLVEFLSHCDRVSDMLAYDEQVMRSLSGQKADLETSKADFESKKAAQETYRKELAVDKADLEKKAKESADMITKLNYTQWLNEAEKQRLEEAQEKMNKELEEAIKELERQKAANKFVGGEFIWPVPGDHMLVTSIAGPRVSPITGLYENHNGTDIPVPFGTDIYASNAGTVVKAVNDPYCSYGNYIMIDHGGGYVTLYAHNSQLLVNVGDTVSKGQVIAKAGSTGDSTGVHCHFSMWINGAIVNPIPLYFAELPIVYW